MLVTLIHETENEPKGFVWEFRGKGKGRLWRVENIGENGKIFHTFSKTNFFIEC